MVPQIPDGKSKLKFSGFIKDSFPIVSQFSSSIWPGDTLTNGNVHVSLVEAGGFKIVAWNHGKLSSCTKGNFDLFNKTLNSFGFWDIIICKQPSDLLRKKIGDKIPDASDTLNLSRFGNFPQFFFSISPGETFLNENCNFSCGNMRFQKSYQRQRWSHPALGLTRRLNRMKP